MASTQERPLPILVLFPEVPFDEGSFLREVAERIDAGVAFWVENRDRLAEIAGTTGVAPHVIVGILGVETFFGRITGRFRVLDALATLGFDYPARGEYTGAV